MQKENSISSNDILLSDIGADCFLIDDECDFISSTLENLTEYGDNSNIELVEDDSYNSIYQLENSISHTKSKNKKDNEQKSKTKKTLKPYIIVSQYNEKERRLGLAPLLTKYPTIEQYKLSETKYKYKLKDLEILGKVSIIYLSSLDDLIDIMNITNKSVVLSELFGKYSHITSKAKPQYLITIYDDSLET